MKKISILLLALACNNKAPTNLKELQKAAEELKIIQQKEAEDLKVGQYALNMMFQTGAATKLSDSKKQILARAIVRITSDVFDNFEHKKAFIAVLAIESGFNKFAQSPTGPKGYSQVTKNTFKEALTMCGVNAINEEDVWETDLNLYSGACYFKSLMTKYDNDVFKAIVAYNQGPASNSAKSYSKNGILNEMEPLKYIARYTFLKNNTPIEKGPNVPAMTAIKKDTK